MAAVVSSCRRHLHPHDQLPSYGPRESDGYVASDRRQEALNRVSVGLRGTGIVPTALSSGQSCFWQRGDRHRQPWQDGDTHQQSRHTAPGDFDDDVESGLCGDGLPGAAGSAELLCHDRHLLASGSAGHSRDCDPHRHAQCIHEPAICSSERHERHSVFTLQSVQSVRSVSHVSVYGAGADQHGPTDADEQPVSGTQRRQYWRRRHPLRQLAAPIRFRAAGTAPSRCASRRWAHMLGRSPVT